MLGSMVGREFWVQRNETLSVGYIMLWSINRIHDHGA